MFYTALPDLYLKYMKLRHFKDKVEPQTEVFRIFYILDVSIWCSVFTDLMWDGWWWWKQGCQYFVHRDRKTKINNYTDELCGWWTEWWRLSCTFKTN